MELNLNFILKIYFIKKNSNNYFISKKKYLFITLILFKFSMSHGKFIKS